MEKSFFIKNTVFGDEKAYILYNSKKYNSTEKYNNNDFLGQNMIAAWHKFPGFNKALPIIKNKKISEKLTKTYKQAFYVEKEDENNIYLNLIDKIEDKKVWVDGSKVYTYGKRVFIYLEQGSLDSFMKNQISGTLSKPFEINNTENLELDVFVLFHSLGYFPDVWKDPDTSGAKYVRFITVSLDGYYIPPKPFLVYNILTPCDFETYYFYAPLNILCGHRGKNHYQKYSCELFAQNLGIPIVLGTTLFGPYGPKNPNGRCE